MWRNTSPSSGGVCRDLSAAQYAERDGAAFTGLGDSVGGDLQRTGDCVLIPLALKGVSYRPMSAAALLRRNLWIYGAGGLVVPFIGIKAIDLLLTLSGWCKERNESVTSGYSIVSAAYPADRRGLSAADHRLAQWWFPSQANGSLIERDGAVRGSEQIGQAFSQPGHFWGRPSATSDVPYNAQASGGSNLAASNPALDKAVAERWLRCALPIPGAGSGAGGAGNRFRQRPDPDISPEAALWQAPRVAAARNMTLKDVEALIARNTERPLLPFIGEETVNVLRLNMALDDLQGIVSNRAKNRAATKCAHTVAAQFIAQCHMVHAIKWTSHERRITAPRSRCPAAQSQRQPSR